MNYHRINNLMTFSKYLLLILAHLPCKAHYDRLNFLSLLNVDLLNVKFIFDHLKEK